MFGACAGRTGSVCGPKGLSVFAVDPGETTGWAWAVVAYKELELVRSGDLAWSVLFGRLLSSGRFDSGQEAIYRGPFSASSAGAALIMNEAQTALALYIEILGLHERSAALTGGSVKQVTDLVIEDFVLRERTKARNLLAPVRLTAALVQEVLRDSKQMGITLQSPSDAKSVVTDDRLRALGLWQVGQVHARDACRHLALFLRKLTVE